jgi:cytochrome P450
MFQEALRIFPPVWRISRHAVGPDRLGGYEVPAGSVVILSPYLLHRDPGLWPEPDRFDPDRFGPDASVSRLREAYLPFGAGRRMCPGGGFATVEAQVVLSTLCRRLTFAPVSGEASPAFEPRLTLRPRGGMPLRVRAADAPPHPSRN